METPRASLSEIYSDCAVASAAAGVTVCYKTNQICRVAQPKSRRYVYFLINKKTYQHARTCNRYITEKKLAIERKNRILFVFSLSTHPLHMPLSTCLSVSISLGLSLSLPVPCLHVFASFCPCLSLFLSLNLKPVCLCLTIHLSVSPSD